MNKKIDLLLVNSFAPRHRIASDAALENSLALIRTYLEEREFGIHVIDEQRVSAIEKGVPKRILRLLRHIVELQIKVHTRGLKCLTMLFVMMSWPFHIATLHFRRKYMDKLIANIVVMVREQNIPVIGIKVWYGAAYKWSVLLAQKIKEVCPETVVIAGGPHVKVYGENVLLNQGFDLAIMGPGEEVLENLLNLRRTVQNKTEFLQLVYGKIGSTPLITAGEFCGQNSLSPTLTTIPRYTRKSLEDKILFHTLVDGIGCTWNKCNFCSHTRQQSSYIPRSITQIRDEFITLTEQGIAFFRFSSSETPVEHGRAIAEMILENNLNIRYSMFVRAGKINHETYEAYCRMIKSGLRAVFMGGETGHDLINEKIMNKGVTRKSIIDTIQCIKLAAAETKTPCRVGLAMIYPCPVLPGVSLEDVFQENLRLVKEAVPDTVIVNPPGIFPGTNWFDQAESFGFTIEDNFVHKMMEYEYSIYKPAKFWPKLDYMLSGQDLPTLLQETGRLSKAIENMGIPIGVSDELLMMLDAIGYRSKVDFLEFKKNSLIDIMSGNSKYLSEIVGRINAQSRALASSNLRKSK